MMKALEKFHMNISSIKNYGQLHSYVESNISLMDCGEILRMQISLSVSALDKYIHDKIIEHGRLQLLNKKAMNSLVSFSGEEISKVSRFQVQSATPSPWVLASSKKTS